MCRDLPNDSTRQVGVNVSASDAEVLDPLSSRHWGAAVRRRRFALLAVVCVVGLSLVAWMLVPVSRGHTIGALRDRVDYELRTHPFRLQQDEVRFVIFYPTLPTSLPLSDGPTATGVSSESRSTLSGRKMLVNVGGSLFEGTITSDRQLWEARDGTFIPIDGVVTKRDLEGYLESANPYERSAEGLLEYARRAQQ